MKHQNIFWGTLLVTLGTLLLLDRTGVFYFNWWAFGKLWPFLLVLWGVSILPVKGAVKIVLALSVAALSVLMYSNYSPAKSERGTTFKYRFNDDDEEDDYSTDQIFTEVYDETTTKAMLDMNAGAGVFKLSGTTGELLFAENKGRNVQFDFKVEELDGLSKISIKQQSDFKIGKNNKGNRFNLMLNPNPVWSFDFDIGAAEFDFDFTDFKVEKIDIDGGAASIKLRVGDLYPETQMTINAGASSIRLDIPRNAGCKIEGTTVLSSRNLPGFEKVSKGHYETPDFENSVQKIYIRVDAAVSSFTVRRD